MPPQQPYHPGLGPQQPQLPQQPQPSFQPQAPQYNYGALPTPPPQPTFQQAPNGQYGVLPAPQNAPNNGNTVQPDHNPYEFIVNPGGANQSGLNINLKGNNFIFKIALLLGAVTVVLIIAGLTITALEPKGSIPGLISIAQRQQEIIRVSNAATTLTQSQDAQNFVANVQASMTSSQTTVLSYLSSHGSKLGAKQLALDHDPATDTQLAAASSANNYDSAVTQQLAGQLQAYDQLLQTSFSQSSSVSVKQMLKADYTGSQLLLTQAKNLENELNNQ